MAFNNEIEQHLQSITKSCLQITRYSSDDDDHQRKQFSQVARALESQLKETPQLFEVLDTGISVVPAIGDISRIQMENIGTSSALCMELLRSGEMDNLFDSDSHRKITEKFFQKASEQAQSACNQDDQATGSSEGQANVEEVRRILEQVRQFTSDSIQDMEQRSAHVKLALKAANTAAEEAHKAAELAQKIGNTAKDEASKAAQAARDASDASTAAQANANTAKDTIQSVQEHAKEAKTNADKALASSKEAETNANIALASSKEAKQQAESLIPSMLTILGIFVAIIIAVVACYLSILLAQNRIDGANGTYSRPFEFMRFLLMGHIMLAIIFLLLYLVSKLTSHSLTCHCKHFAQSTTCSDASNSECSQCQHNCSSPVRLRSRYPYVFGINLAFTIGYTVLGLWQVINVYYRSAIDELIHRYPIPCAIAIAIIASVPIIVVCCVFRRKR